MRTTFTTVLRATVAVAALAGLASPAHATTLTFDDISASCNAAVGSYGGVTFSSFTTECNADYTDSGGYANSYAANGGFAAFNDFGLGESDISIGSGSFSLVQASFSSFAQANAIAPFSSASLAVAGYKAGDSILAPTYYTTFDLDPTQYVSQAFGWTDLTTLAFFTGNGPATDLLTQFGSDGFWWLIDDMQIDVNPGGPAPVPEPGTLMLVALGLGGIARARAGGVRRASSALLTDRFGIASTRRAHA